MKETLTEKNNKHTVNSPAVVFPGEASTPR